MIDVFVDILDASDNLFDRLLRNNDKASVVCLDFCDDYNDCVALRIERLRCVVVQRVERVLAGTVTDGEEWLLIGEQRLTNRLMT